jgi:hypothetical protein
VEADGLAPARLCGFSLGSPMNLIMVIASLPRFARTLDLPLEFRRTSGNRGATYQCIDS